MHAKVTSPVFLWQNDTTTFCTAVGVTPPISAVCWLYDDACVNAGMTLCGALPVALLVKSPAVLALVSQASVSFVFLFAVVVAVMSLSPSQSHSKLRVLPKHI